MSESGSPKKITIHTDGACDGNPGPGGWAALLRYGAHVRELAGGEPAEGFPLKCPGVPWRATKCQGVLGNANRAESGKCAESSANWHLLER